MLGTQKVQARNFASEQNDINDVKIVCVVVADIKLNTKNKTYDLINKGLQTKTITWINNLENIICEYFNINTSIIQNTNMLNTVNKTNKTTHNSKSDSNTGLNRDTIDKYYTKNTVVDFCIELIKQHIEISKNDLIIEPSAGNGAFIENIKLLSDNYLFFDIEPENDLIIKQDFLSYNLTTKQKQILKPLSKIHIIGNPPFGRQSSTAIKFIKKSAEFADTISFILPKSFKKQSVKDKLPLNFHLKYEIDVPNNGFLVNGIEHDVPCVFQIWEKSLIQNRAKSTKLEPTFYKFVKKNEKPDIAFRRVGVYAGKIYQDINDKSEESHFFIKFTNDDTIENNMNKFKSINFETNNTVGPKSISKQELIKYTNNIEDNEIKQNVEVNVESNVDQIVEKKIIETNVSKPKIIKPVITMPTKTKVINKKVKKLINNSQTLDV